MAQGSINTGVAAQPIHVRTTPAGFYSQAVVLGLDGSNSVVPADATLGLSVSVERFLGKLAADLIGAGGGIKTEGSTGENTKSFLSSGAVVADFVKAGAGVLTGLEFFKTTSGPAYLRLYNKVSAPAAGDTPVWRAVIGGSTGGDVGGFIKTFVNGLVFSTGIALRITALAPDNDNTAVSGASAVLGNIDYI